MNTWTIEVECDEDGESFITLPPEALEIVGWKEGDNLTWKDNGDGSWTLTKKEDDVSP
jgi:hypothetical protein